ncbi:LOW QUALITY PROTEIN: uncharacterized protein FPRO_13972 [Fusarium proliferatum ET1]|uniref:Uncharacterized protein n=1 Tax=Fusarium proliferatum (strain ET1) TaxID=1227346 RepID=A0A1L7VUU0_FUSPR|nr:LOW QUALITY PROTEIN: uncharacterized protein FPRO_13972 [Fusarium proliferatum ET1]CZR44193.1 uncharacterized protein FPRO_13972 [Fusarium proliferatum ET1]
MESCGVWQQAPRNKSLSLLLVSKRFYVEVQDIFRRLPNNYHVDIIEELWVLAYVVYCKATDITLHRQSNIEYPHLEPTDDLDDRFKDSLSFSGGDAGPGGAVWAIYELLVSLIQHEPGYLGLQNNQRFVINEIEVNVVAPTDGAAHTKLSCRDNDYPWWLRWSCIECAKDLVPEERLANFMTSHLDAVFSVRADTMPYCQVLYDHIIESITFQLNGQEWQKRRIDEYLEKSHPSTWPQDYRNGWCRKTLKTRQRIRMIRRRREKVRKGLELDDKQPK